MNLEKKSMLTYLMELDFALAETNSYINNHPIDDNAIILQNTIAEKYQNLKFIYESKYGTLNHKF